MLEKDNIKRVLRSINRFLPDRILTLWLERNQPFLSHTKILTPNEFLFLVCNTRDRAEAIAELPYGERTLARDTGNKTFSWMKLSNSTLRLSAGCSAMQTKPTTTIALST